MSAGISWFFMDVQAAGRPPVVQPGIDRGRRRRHVWQAMSESTAPAAVSMETIVALCKRRGFIFQSSEIYGGLNGFFDYGPLGVELKKNIRDCWWNDMVRRRDDVVGLESSIIMHPKVWEASGHVAGFTDPLVDCKVSKQRYRADQLFFAPVVVDGQTVGYVSALESERTAAELQEAAEAFKRKKAIQGTLAPVTAKDFTEAREDESPSSPPPPPASPAASPRRARST
jgi:glycyl-tRNA synthetase